MLILGEIKVFPQAIARQMQFLSQDNLGKAAAIILTKNYQKIKKTEFITNVC